MRPGEITARQGDGPSGGRYGRLACYVLPGGVTDSRAALTQAAAAERIGMGGVWIGERYDTKDLPALAGAIAATTGRVRIGAGVTHFGLRHPMVLASMGQTLQSLSGGRFTLGFGRSASWRWDAYGVPEPTLRTMADTAGILRSLWAGGTVSYDGPAGCYPQLRLAQRPDAPAPDMLLAAVGPRTLALAGACFDGAILHPFLTVDAVSQSCRIVRQAAADAGRDPETVRCVVTVVVAPDRTAADTDLAIGARAAGYFSVPGLGDSLVRANGWDRSELERYRSHPVLRALGDRSADKTLSRPELIELSRELPEGWLETTALAGTAAYCAAGLHRYLRAGADEIIVHGSTAEHLDGLAGAFGPSAPAAGERLGG
ncbi:TIGR03857 family LLM class F420-dependent oxidoreductase [Acidiferrimicrobium sp. IK]|uniref:TIGR03857 family LLM class F420-dependent oxidoreductase n=1 Tax=Acidiferrimicrobium sp. IK TaxID=2871700 RepID=UPI0021CB4788|nr:TIGR03857 family LLM class F420-dependent oxidoreductase [Acidiferrimicrobium sp. IK]MCU4183468.1 TIGR03857 family LLM class F420-dependent oxidoreductase [Acidiferrimicrobium sp. IK]